MINIVLYDNQSVFKIIEKARLFFSDYDDIEIAKDTIWLNGVYLRFGLNQITVNPYNETRFSKKMLCDCLSCLLNGEEVYITDGTKNRQYIEIVDHSTQFDKILKLGMI